MHTSPKLSLLYCSKSTTFSDLDCFFSLREYPSIYPKGENRWAEQARSWIELSDFFLVGHFGLFRFSAIDLSCGSMFSRQVVHKYLVILQLHIEMQDATQKPKVKMALLVFTLDKQVFVFKTQHKHTETCMFIYRRRKMSDEEGMKAMSEEGKRIG